MLPSLLICCCIVCNSRGRLLVPLTWRFIFSKVAPHFTGVEELYNCLWVVNHLPWTSDCRPVPWFPATTVVAHANKTLHDSSRSHSPDGATSHVVSARVSCAHCNSNPPTRSKSGSANMLVLCSENKFILNLFDRLHEQQKASFRSRPTTLKCRWLFQAEPRQKHSMCLKSC